MMIPHAWATWALPRITRSKHREARTKRAKAKARKRREP